MIQLCVTRVIGCCGDDPDDSLGCVVGDSIVNELIQTNTVAESAGRAYIDDEGYDFTVIEASCSLHGYLAPGTLVKVRDREHGEYIAEVDTFSSTFSRNSRSQISAVTSVKLKKVT